jgi:cell fate (sporulation/competence/biofilm development) regulator YmcA (YheA/YmcA/DUF963 family)
MSDLVDQYRRDLPNMSDQDKADALKVVEEQIEATMQQVQTCAKPIVEGFSKAYRDAYSRIAEKYRRDVEELEHLKGLLES